MVADITEAITEAEQQMMPTDQQNMTVDSLAPSAHLANRTSSLVEACVRMFDKLRGTAHFFRALLTSLGAGEGDAEFPGGAEALRNIEALALDLDRSVEEARSLLVEAKGLF